MDINSYSPDEATAAMMILLTHHGALFTSKDYLLRMELSP